MNALVLEATVQNGTDKFANPRRVSDIFSVCNVVVPNPRGRAFIDLVGDGDMAERLAALQPGDTIQATCRLDSHRNPQTGVWRLRAWVDDLALVDPTDEPNGTDQAALALNAIELTEQSVAREEPER
jgi:hypothetical protein